MKENYLETVKEIYALLMKRERLSSIMLAEELLAKTFNQWRAKTENRGTLARQLIIVSTAYAETMIASARYKEGYAACITAIAYTAREKVKAEDMMSIYVTAWQALSGVLMNSEPSTDNQVREQVKIVTSSIGTMLYHYYYEAGQQNANKNLMLDAYQSLKDITEFVDIMTDVDGYIPVITDLVRNSELLNLTE